MTTTSTSTKGLPGSPKEQDDATQRHGRKE